MDSTEPAASQKRVIAGIAVLVVAYAIWFAARPQPETATHAPASESASHEAPAGPAVYSVLPFVALLGAIALMPLMHATGHWWEHNRNKLTVAAGLGLVTLTYYGLLYGHGVEDHMAHGTSAPGFAAAATILKNAVLADYVPFMVLLFSLYVISGGILIEGRLAGRPTFNVTIIGIGAVLASLIGTTGAAMLLIRPLLKANVNRRYVAHTMIFFIFVVCNTGGCLLPIGDPPLFLGYLRGVPFLWTLQLWKQWAFMNVLLLAIYFAWDTIRYRSEEATNVESPPEQASQPFAIRGAVNFLWLAGVIVAVGLLDPSKAFPGTDWHPPLYFREMTMLTLAGLSLATTSAAVRAGNHFSYGAILEVAALFIGIFICMQPPIQLLNLHGASLGFDQPWKFFWGSGMLSSFLDNAPTYVVFFETARAGGEAAHPVHPVGVDFQTLVAISCGSVFMGANTYIGNGPNFMVKAIAEANNVRMPSFFGYMLYSVGVLIPLFILMTVLFFA